MSLSKPPDVCASSRPKQQLYETLHTTFTEDHFIIFTLRLFLKHTEDDFNLLSTFTLKQGIRFTRGCVQWLMLVLSLIWSEQHKHFLAAYLVSTERQEPLLGVHCVSTAINYFITRVLFLNVGEENTSARGSRRRADTERRVESVRFSCVV